MFQEPPFLARASGCPTTVHLGEYEVVAEEGDRLVVEVRLRTPEAVAFAEGTGDPLMAKWLELSCPAYLERWVRDNGARWPMKQ